MITNAEFYDGYKFKDRRGNVVWISRSEELLCLTHIYSDVVGVKFKKAHGSTGVKVINNFFSTRANDPYLIEEFSKFVTSKYDPGVYRNRHEELAKHLKLVADPKNRFDPNAIAVWLRYKNNWREIGFLPASLAEILTRIDGKIFITSFMKKKSHMAIRMVLDSDSQRVNRIPAIIVRKTIPKKRRELVLA